MELTHTCHSVSFVFSIYMIIPPITNDGFVFLFPVLSPYLSFSCCACYDSHCMSNNEDSSLPSCFQRKNFNFLMLDYHIAIIRSRFHLHLNYWKVFSFNDEWMLNFIDCIFCFCWVGHMFLPCSVNATGCVDWFLKWKTSSWY